MQGLSGSPNQLLIERASAEEQLHAELVVDASGRASKMPAWLQAIGYDAPEETVINAHPGYASRIYEIPAGFRRLGKCAASHIHLRLSSSLDKK